MNEMHLSIKTSVEIKKKVFCLSYRISSFLKNSLNLNVNKIIKSADRINFF